MLDVRVLQLQFWNLLCDEEDVGRAGTLRFELFGLLLVITIRRLALFKQFGVVRVSALGVVFHREVAVFLSLSNLFVMARSVFIRKFDERLPLLLCHFRPLFGSLLHQVCRLSILLRLSE